MLPKFFDSEKKPIPEKSTKSIKKVNCFLKNVFIVHKLNLYYVKIPITLFSFLNIASYPHQIHFFRNPSNRPRKKKRKESKDAKCLRFTPDPFLLFSCTYPIS